MSAVDVVNSREFAENFLSDQEKRHKNPELYRGFQTPIAWLTELTGGLQIGWLIYIYGKAKAGKTSLLATLATHFGKAGKLGVWCGLEECLDMTEQRIVSNLGNISRIKFRNIELTASDWPLVTNAANIIKDFNFIWTYGAYTQGDITELVKRYKPELLFLDYIQLMMGSGSTLSLSSKTIEVAENSKYLKRLANGDYTNGSKICVIAAAQLNDDGEPLWSRDLHRDSDLTIQVIRPLDGVGQPIEDRRILDTKYFRHGPTGSHEVGFIGTRSLLVEMVSPDIKI